jgi:hypothetical protein
MWPGTEVAHLWCGDVDEAAHFLVTTGVQAPLHWVLQGEGDSQRAQ